MPGVSKVQITLNRLLTADQLRKAVDNLSHPSGSWGAWALISLVVVSAVGWMAFVDERPFWITTTDPEQDYYFNSLAILDSGFPDGVRHPGTPAYYFGAIALALSGTDFSDAQRFFNFTYVLVALLSVIAAAVFTRVALKNVPFAPSLLVLSPVLLWPPFLTYANYFSVESFLFAVSLLTSAFVYWTLQRSKKFDIRALVVIGIFVGFGAALKFTFAALGFSIGLMLISSVWWFSGAVSPAQKIRLMIRHLVIFAAVVVAAFIVFVLPVLRHFYEFIGRLRIELSRSAGGESISTAIGRFVQIAPEFAILVLVAIVALLALIVVRKSRLKNRLFVGDEGEHSLAMAPVLGLLIALLGFGVILIRSIPDPDAALYADGGVYLRGLTPIAGFLPLALLIVWKLQSGISSRFITTSVRARARDGVLVLVAAVLIASSLSSYMSWRTDTYSEINEAVVLRNDSFGSVLPAGSRVAIWDTGDLFGEPMFFFWGNYRYAIDRFDEDVLAEYPAFTILRVRDFLSYKYSGAAPSSRSTGAGESEGFLRGPLQGIYDSVITNWKEAFPRRSRTGEVVTGESGPSGVTHVMYRPENVAFLSNGGVDGESKVQQVLEDRFGQVSMTRIQIGSETWVIGELPSK